MEYTINYNIGMLNVLVDYVVLFKLVKLEKNEDEELFNYIKNRNINKINILLFTHNKLHFYIKIRIHKSTEWFKNLTNVKTFYEILYDFALYSKFLATNKNLKPKMVKGIISFVQN